MLQFPDEVVCYVLSFLNPSDLLQLSFTCTRLHDILLEEDLWRLSTYAHMQKILLTKRFPNSHRELLALAKEFNTIKNAMTVATEGDFLLLLPGIYEESVSIQKRVHIIGWDPDRTNTIITNSCGCVLTCTAPSFLVKNLTLKQAYTKLSTSERQQRSNIFFCVDISGGGIIEGCDISSSGRSCLGIHKKTAAPIIRGNVIHHSNAAGVCVFDYATPIITENEIFSAKFSGVEITLNANPVLSKNRIHSNMGSGVYVHGSGRGELYENEIFCNESSGVNISSQGNPLLEKNIIHDGKRAGVYICEEGRGRLVENRIYNNTYNGIENLSSSITVENNTEYGNKKVPEDIQRALARGDCTYKITGTSHKVQDWYHCVTCKLVGNDGCCVSCAENCHKGHDIHYYKFGLFFCDCGDRNKNCQALH